VANNNTTILLIDVGNTNTHIGLATEKKILAQADIPTSSLPTGSLTRAAKKIGGKKISGAIIASVVPKIIPVVRAELARQFRITPLIVSADIPLGVRVDYPNKKQIGADRLANAVGVFKLYGAPAIVVDFGTAVTFDIVDKRGAYIGGVIAPGLAAMTDYLYQRTALLPKINLVEPRSMIGKNTVQAMQIGAVVGYRGLIQEILTDVKRELRTNKLHVVATGGYSKLIAKKIPDIQHVNPLLTLEGLRFIYLLNRRGAESTEN
jgi:type III pantothenate kinase